jgi:hypothetical protein
LGWADRKKPGSSHVFHPIIPLPAKRLITIATADFEPVDRAFLCRVLQNCVKPSAVQQKWEMAKDFAGELFIPD